jgi:hypothetical protein
MATSSHRISNETTIRHFFRIVAMDGAVQETLPLLKQVAVQPLLDPKGT